MGAVRLKRDVDYILVLEATLHQGRSERIQGITVHSDALLNFSPQTLSVRVVAVSLGSALLAPSCLVEPG